MEDFGAYRPLLFGIAYRMLGSASEAEDIVQDAYLRYSAAPEREVRSPKSYLSTIVTRLCLDHLKSARVRREQYLGPWLPEPILTPDDRLSPLDTIEQRESISVAFLVLLERLTPQERAVFLLREVFEYSYEEIASMLNIGVPNCRQIFHRARERIAEGKPRYEANPHIQEQLTTRFVAACERGDLPALTELLAQDVTVWSDGGGKAVAARRPVVGGDKVIRFWLGLVRTAPSGIYVTHEEVNGMPAVLIWVGDNLISVVSTEVEDSRIKAFRAILNPDKLAFILRQRSDGGRKAEGGPLK